MTDIPVGGFVVEESGWTRFKRQIGAGFRAIGRGLKTAATAIWNGTKATASFLGRGAMKALGLTGTSIGWFIGIVITAVVVIATAVVWLLLTALIGLVWLLRWVWDVLDTYIIGVFRYLARKDRKATFRMVNSNRKSVVFTRLTAWYVALMALRVRWENYEGPTGDIDTLVKEAEASGHKLTDREIDIINKANAESDLGIDAVMEQPPSEAKMAEALRLKMERLAANPDLADLDDSAVTENQVIAAIQDFITEEGTYRMRVDFDFTPYVSASGKNYAVLQAMGWLRDTSADIGETSYWLGRIEALQAFENDRNLDHAKQQWAMLYTRVKNRQAEISAGVVKTGFFDMVAELRAKQLEPRTRGVKR